MIFSISDESAQTCYINLAYISPSFHNTDVHIDFIKSLVKDKIVNFFQKAYSILEITEMA